MEGANSAAFLDVFKTFGQAGINEPPLRWGVLTIGVRKLRAVDYQLWSEDNFTAVEGVGIFWHIVDLVWIFLFPLLYLIG